jgi:hypothetical protein
VAGLLDEPSMDSMPAGEDGCDVVLAVGAVGDGVASGPSRVTRWRSSRTALSAR